MTTDATCPKCGGTEWQDGAIVWNAPIRFKANDISWLSKQFSRGEPVKARVCRSCGHVELSVDLP